MYTREREDLQGNVENFSSHPQVEIPQPQWAFALRVLLATINIAKQWLSK